MNNIWLFDFGFITICFCGFCAVCNSPASVCLLPLPQDSAENKAGNTLVIFSQDFAVQQSHATESLCVQKSCTAVLQSVHKGDSAARQSRPCVLSLMLFLIPIHILFSNTFCLLIGVFRLGIWLIFVLRNVLYP